MSEEEQIQQELQYHPLDKQISQIENNHQYKPQGNQNQDEQDSPFQQLQLILGLEDDKMNKKQSFQTDNFQQLESKCRNIEKQNVQLLKKIEQLQSELQLQNQTQDDNQKITQIIQLLQSQISNYKNQFQQFKNIHIQKFKLKQSIINQCKQKIAYLTQQNQKLHQQCNNLSQKNQQLVLINQGLIDQIQKLQKQLNKSRSEINSTNSFYYQDKKYPQFQQQVQAQLELLIEKLVSQLQFERGQKKRSNQQIKRMKRTIMELQRQITIKNNKIYTLEIKSLQKHKEPSKEYKYQTDNPQHHILKQSKSSSQLHYDANNRHKSQTPTIKKFNLKQLLQIAQISERQRFIVSSKIVDFYIKKVRAKNYSTLTVQDILICNFSKENPNLIIIKNKLDSLVPKGDSNVQNLIKNLAFIIENILGQILNSKQLKSQSEAQLIYLIYKIIQEGSSNLQEIYHLKRYLDQIIDQTN